MDIEDLVIEDLDLPVLKQWELFDIVERKNINDLKIFVEYNKKHLMNCLVNISDWEFITLFPVGVVDPVGFYLKEDDFIKYIIKAYEFKEGK